MHIFTLDDQDFPYLLEAWSDAQPVGRYWKKGKVQIVRATKQFVLVARGEGAPTKIALRPARNLTEAQALALDFLGRKANDGSDIELDVFVFQE